MVVAHSIDLVHGGTSAAGFRTAYIARPDEMAGAMALIRWLVRWMSKSSGQCAATDQVKWVRLWNEETRAFALAAILIVAGLFVWH